MTVSRALSLVIAAGIVVLGFRLNGIEGAASFALVLLLPLACIWFGDDLGHYMGSNFGSQAINRVTPGCMAAFAGWVLLVVIAVLGLTLTLSGH